MDLNLIDISEYDFVAPTAIEYNKTDAEETFIDLNIEDDHTFFVYLTENDKYILSHNCDGTHIAGLYIGFLFKYFPSIIQENKLKRLRTPIMALKDNKDNIKYFFFTLDEYNEFIKTNDISKYKLHYYKGLGSWEPKDLQPLISKYGLEYFLETFILDKEGNISIDNWLNSKNADKRKEYLKQNEFNILNI